MVAIAERYGASTVFMGEDMEVAGAFGMNVPSKIKAIRFATRYASL